MLRLPAVERYLPPHTNKLKFPKLLKQFAETVIVGVSLLVICGNCGDNSETPEALQEAAYPRFAQRYRSDDNERKAELPTLVGV